MITTIVASPLKNKKYRAVFSDNSKIDFGLAGSQTYLDHHDKIKRDNYRKRHLGNTREKYLINNRIPSPALLSFYLLWGEYTALDKNVAVLNRLL